MSEPADLGANLKNCPSLTNYAPSSNTYSPAQRFVQTTEDRSEPTLKWRCEDETGISVKYMKVSVGGHTQPRAAIPTVPISEQLKALSAFHIPYFAKVPVWFIHYVGVCRGFCRYRNCSSFNIELKKKKKYFQRVLFLPLLVKLQWGNKVKNFLSADFHCMLFVVGYLQDTPLP